MIKINSDSKYRYIKSLNSDGTVVLAENKSTSEKCVLREVDEKSLPIYKKICRHPHENIEAVKRIIAVKGGYIAECEFCRGSTLRELEEQQDSIVVVGANEIAAQLCGAGRHLAKLGIVHRDITPNNIIINTHHFSKLFVLKLIDFDISRRHSGSKPHDTSFYGTRGFAAPEQYGFSETDFLTDIYAIGRVLLDMVETIGYTNYRNYLAVKLYKIIRKSTKYSPKERYKSYDILEKDVAKMFQAERIVMALMLRRYRTAFRLLFEKPRIAKNIVEDIPIV